MIQFVSVQNLRAEGDARPELPALPAESWVVGLNDERNGNSRNAWASKLTAVDADVDAVFAAPFRGGATPIDLATPGPATAIMEAAVRVRALGRFEDVAPDSRLWYAALVCSADHKTRFAAELGRWGLADNPSSQRLLYRFVLATDFLLRTDPSAVELAEEAWEIWLAGRGQPALALAARRSRPSRGRSARVAAKALLTGRLGVSDPPASKSKASSDRVVDTLTVAIPAFNASAYIEHAVSSALSQDDDRVRVLVVDDCSSDTTFEQARSFDDERLTVVRNQRNLGRAANIDRTIRAAAPGLVTLLPADCALPSDGVQIRREAVAGAGSDALVFGRVAYVDGEGSALGEHRPFDYSWTAPAPTALRRLMPDDPVFTSSACFAKERYESVGGLRIEISPSHRDWDLFLRLGATGPVSYVDRPTSIERLHADNFTTFATENDRHVFYATLVLRAFCDWCQANAAEAVPDAMAGVDQFASNLLKTSLRQDVSDARRLVGLAAFASPTTSVWLRVARAHLLWPGPASRVIERMSEARYRSPRSRGG